LHWEARNAEKPRTLKAEVLFGRQFADLAECLRAFDSWRHIYNYERPY